mmetsp:Transcript_19806/g.35327  ORF Transcript_19806/g.35327 Transcript_19806/m.35327 type:complete len:294 (-) Transcript_19806:243-1124(-)
MLQFGVLELVILALVGCAPARSDAAPWRMMRPHEGRRLAHGTKKTLAAVTTDTATCTVKGDPHVTSFSNETYSFQAKGEFVLFEEIKSDWLLTNCFAFQRAGMPSYVVQSAFACGQDIVLSQVNPIPALPMDVFHFRFEGSATASTHDSDSAVSFVPTNTRATAFEAGLIKCTRVAHTLSCSCKGLTQESVFFKNHDRGYQILNVKVTAPQVPASVNAPQAPASTDRGLCLDEASRFFTSDHSSFNKCFKSPDQGCNEKERSRIRLVQEKYGSASLIGLLAEAFEEVDTCYNL